MPATLVEVDYHYGSPGDLGGGPYRRAWRIRRDLDLDLLQVNAAGAAGAFSTIGAALAAWAAAGGAGATIRITDRASSSKKATGRMPRAAFRSGTT